MCLCLCNERQAENEKTSLTAKLERITAECERMKKDALLKSSTVDSMMKQQEEENAELHKAVKKLKDQLRTASEDGKRAGRMVEGLKKQVEELRLEIRVRCAFAIPLPSHSPSWYSHAWHMVWDGAGRSKGGPAQDQA